MRPLRGRVALYDRIILFYLIFGMLLTAGIAIIMGFFVHYGVSIALGLLYFMFLGIFVIVIKRKTSTLIKNAHFCLSLFLHVENNR